MLIGMFIAIGGVAIIAACVAPTPLKTWLNESIHPMFTSLAVTVINAVGPAIIKVLVKAEQWSSPAVTLRQATVRIYDRTRWSNAMHSSPHHPLATRGRCGHLASRWSTRSPSIRAWRSATPLSCNICIHHQHMHSS